MRKMKTKEGYVEHEITWIFAGSQNKPIKNFIELLQNEEKKCKEM